MEPAREKLPETVAALPSEGPDEIRPEASPFASRDWRTLSYAWCGFLLRILLIFGGVFSVLQYLQAREEKRVERTLELVELWERTEYQEAQRAVKVRLAGVSERSGNLLGQSPSEAEMAFLQKRIGLEVMSAEGGTMPLLEFQERFDRIVYFLNRVSFCVEGNLCSREVADAYFLDYAQSFWAYFAGYVERQRKAGATKFAQPIEEYVTAER